MDAQIYLAPSYRLSDISIPAESSKLAQITSTFVLRQRAKDKRIYDETGCWFVSYICDCNRECTCKPECDCVGYEPCKHCRCVDEVYPCSNHDPCPEHVCSCNPDNPCGCYTG